MRINPILSDDSIISGVDKVLKVIPDNKVMIKPVRNDS